MTYLHSNMDRLKRQQRAERRANGQHLHSNMDRLKQSTIANKASKEHIYIPIWID